MVANTLKYANKGHPISTSKFVIFICQFSFTCATLQRRIRETLENLFAHIKYRKTYTDPTLFGSKGFLAHQVQHGQDPLLLMDKANAVAVYDEMHKSIQLL